MANGDQKLIAALEQQDAALKENAPDRPPAPFKAKKSVCHKPKQHWHGHFYNPLNL
jgi:hypothetical protein